MRMPYLWVIFQNIWQLKTGLYGYEYDFLVDYKSVGVDDILDIHKYLIKKHNIK